MGVGSESDRTVEEEEEEKERRRTLSPPCKGTVRR